MNNRTKELANQSYFLAFDKCRLVEHTVGNIDSIFVGFAMNEMSKAVVKDCIEKLKIKGYVDAAKCLEDELVS